MPAVLPSASKLDHRLHVAGPRRMPVSSRAHGDRLLGPGIPTGHPEDHDFFSMNFQKRPAVPTHESLPEISIDPAGSHIGPAGWAS